MTYRNRIKELRMVRVQDLQPDPRNWRGHPATQRQALTAMLERIGLADAVLVRETETGLVLIDGHLRQDILGSAPDTRVPCLILDLDEQEAGEVMGTLDPLAGMAVADEIALADLLATLPTEVQAPLGELYADPQIPELELDLDAVPEVGSEPSAAGTTCPRCGHVF